MLQLRLRCRSADRPCRKERLRQVSSACFRSKLGPGNGQSQTRAGEKFMRIHNLYVDDKGETHFRDVQVEWKHEGRGGKTSDTFPATGIIFRETPGTYDYEWHPAPRRQYIINLDGGVSIQASDGETRIIGAGEVLLVEDTSGKGHFSKAISGQMRHSIFVPIE